MLNKELPCFLLQLQEGGARKLIPGKAIELDGSGCVIAFESPLTLQVGDDVSLCAEWRNKFHQQFATVTSLPASESSAFVEFERKGEPVNCESRGIYRVNVLLRDITCTVGKERNCALADVSLEGISVIVKRPLQLGSMVDVEFTVEKRQAVGVMRVLSVKELADGGLRYGMIAPDKKSPLRKSLEAISSMMQRHQLRRLAGAA